MGVSYDTAVHNQRDPRIASRVKSLHMDRFRLEMEPSHRSRVSERVFNVGWIRVRKSDGVVVSRRLTLCDTHTYSMRVLCKQHARV